MKINVLENGVAVTRDMTAEEEAEYGREFPYINEPSQLDRIESQLAYTAMMTDTLIEEE